MRELINRFARRDERLWRLAVRSADAVPALRELLAMPWETLRLLAVLVRVSRARENAPPQRPFEETPQVCMLVVSDLHRDPRVERSATALVEAGFPVTVVCPRLSRDDVHDPPHWGPSISIVMLPFRKTFFRFPYLYDTVMEREADRLDCALIHCNDLNTALIGLSVAHRRRSLCICDFHEWWSENAKFDRVTGRFKPLSGVVRALSKKVERLALQRADAVVTVSQSIVDALVREYHATRPVYLIRNMPAVSRRHTADYDLRAQLDVPNDWFVLLYQGGVGPSRHLEPIIDAVSRVERVTLVIRGPGVDVYAHAYRRRAADLGILERVVCLPPVPSADVVAACRGADAGIWTLAAICRNFELALPNKVFEYLAAGLPILVAHHPEPKRIVDEYQCGCCFDPDDPEDIARSIAQLRDDTSLRRQFARNAADASRGYDPVAESLKLSDLCQDLLREGQNSRIPAR